MPDKIVLDSSIIAAIFFKEKASTRVIEAIQKDYDLITVDLAIAEVANIAWKRVTIFQENKEIIGEALKKCIEFINTACIVIKTEELIDESFEISLKLKISFYDSLFLAAAEKEKVFLLSLDKKLGKASKRVEII